MTDKTLFIGGPKDGTREAIPPGAPTAKCALFTALHSTPVDLKDACIGMDVHTYLIHEWPRSNGQVLRIAVHSSIKDINAQLVKGYRYHRKKYLRRRKNKHWTLDPRPPRYELRNGRYVRVS